MTPTPSPIPPPILLPRAAGIAAHPGNWDEAAARLDAAGAVGEAGLLRRLAALWADAASSDEDFAPVAFDFEAVPPEWCVVVGVGIAARCHTWLGAAFAPYAEALAACLYAEPAEDEHWGRLTVAHHAPVLSGRVADAARAAEAATERCGWYSAEAYAAAAVARVVAMRCWNGEPVGDNRRYKTGHPADLLLAAARDAVFSAQAARNGGSLPGKPSKKVEPPDDPESHRQLAWMNGVGVIGGYGNGMGWTEDQADEEAYLLQMREFEERLNRGRNE